MGQPKRKIGHGGFKNGEHRYRSFHTRRSSGGFAHHSGLVHHLCPRDDRSAPNGLDQKDRQDHAIHHQRLHRSFYSGGQRFIARTQGHNPLAIHR